MKKMSVCVNEKAIRKLMLEKDIKTITELAEKSGVSKPTIYGYFNGQSPISTAFIRLCDYLEIQPEEMLIVDPTGSESEDVNV